VPSISGQQTLTLGDTSPIVLEVADRLFRVGHLANPRRAGAVFDDELAEAIRHFQQDQGLLVDGVVNDETYQRLEEARWELGDRVLFRSSGKLMAGDDVADLQTKLAELGFETGRVDGLFGRNTENALKEFQRSMGLTQDGICGSVIYKALGQLTRTVAGGNPHLLRAQLNPDHFSGVQTRSIVIDTNAEHATDPCFDLISRIEGRLAALGSTVITATGLIQSDSNSRSDFVNDLGSDVYLNISQTSFTSPRAQGCATYYFAGRPGASSLRGQLLAELLQEEISSHTNLLNGRTHGKSWDLLRKTQMPAVQIEIAYETNDHDQDLLSNPNVRDKISVAVASGLTRFFQPNLVQ
jgi:N-acetylmuramoyl-L-alanine amidase